MFHCCKWKLQTKKRTQSYYQELWTWHLPATCIILYQCSGDTPTKLNKEPESDGFQKGSPFSKGWFLLRFHVRLQGCMWVLPVRFFWEDTVPMFQAWTPAASKGTCLKARYAGVHPWKRLEPKVIEICFRWFSFLIGWFFQVPAVNFPVFFPWTKILPHKRFVSPRPHDPKIIATKSFRLLRGFKVIEGSKLCQVYLWNAEKISGETILAHHRENLGGQPGSSLDKSQKKHFIGSLNLEF